MHMVAVPAARPAAAAAAVSSSNCRASSRTCVRRCAPSAPDWRRSHPFPHAAAPATAGEAAYAMPAMPVPLRTGSGHGRRQQYLLVAQRQPIAAVLQQRPRAQPLPTLRQQAAQAAGFALSAAASSCRLSTSRARSSARRCAACSSNSRPALARRSPFSSHGARCSAGSFNQPRTSRAGRLSWVAATVNNCWVARGSEVIPLCLRGVAVREYPLVEHAQPRQPALETTRTQLGQPGLAQPRHSGLQQLGGLHRTVVAE